MNSITNSNIKDERLKLLLKVFNGKKIALYGAGKRGMAALKNLERLNVNVVGFIDDNAEREGMKINGKYEVFTIEKALNKWNNQKDLHVIITNFCVTEVIKNIENTDIDIRNIYFYNELLLDEDKDGIFLEESENIDKVYNLLEDGVSKFLYKSTIEIRQNGNLGILSRTISDNQYFSIFEELKDLNLLGDHEVYVDAGAYDGDTIDQFIRVVDNKFNGIYGFEPETANFDRMRKKEYDERIHLYKAGLFEECTVLNFSEGLGTSSTVSKNGTGNVSIEVKSLDGMGLQNKDITFIKMDIEGSELSALKGASGIIKESKPKLAICIYHQVEDLWEIPLYIASIRDDYKFYIRNYTDRLDEMVLYAI